MKRYIKSSVATNRYDFILDGHTYSVADINVLDAKTKAEFAFGKDFDNCEWVEYYKLRPVERGWFVNGRIKFKR